MLKILILGGNGQLAQCSVDIIKEKYTSQIIFKSPSSELDITDEESVQDYLSLFKPDYIINCAAYTAVDAAENPDQLEKVYAINAYAPAKIAEYAKKKGIHFIHISTDYVFNGDTEIPYDEDSWTDPTSVYGKSKLLGEELIMESNHQSIIIRTSWVYSEYGKNFVKTMLRLFSEKDEISVVDDQFGQPTYAKDLAECILLIVHYPFWQPGIYNYSNSGEISWYEFAIAIKSIAHSKIKINPISTDLYPTLAKRPKRSSLCLDKIEQKFGIQSPFWEESLVKCLSNLDF